MDTQNSLRDGLLTVVLPAYNEQDSVPPGGRYHLSSAGERGNPARDSLCQRRLPGRNLEGDPGPDCPASSGAGSLFFPQLW